MRVRTGRFESLRSGESGHPQVGAHAGRTTKKSHRSGLCLDRRGDQLRVWSTSLFLAIQGIMARSWAPTTSIW
ncbi:MAG: hypothetical protein C0443_09805 [Comamonadaceae bacterium]|nr:hypothetical protein [Comamonadaceae bacterium]